MPDLSSLSQTQALAKRTILGTRDARIDAGSVTKAGSMMNILVAIQHAIGQDIEARALAKLNALTYGARGRELDAVIAERTFGQVNRKGASPALLPITLTRTGAAGAGSIAALEKFTANGIVFSLDASVSWTSGQLGPITAYATATSAGSATNVPSTAACAWQTIGNLFDPLITIACADNATGGDEEELDSTFIARAIRFPADVQKGVAGAVVGAALNVAGIKHAVATEEASLFGYVPPTLYLADINGQCNVALLAKVRAALLDARALGIVPYLVGSIPTFVTLVLKIGYLDGYAVQSVQDYARAVAIAAVNALGPMDRLDPKATIAAALKTVPGIVATDDSVVTPVGPLLPVSGQTFRTRTELISFV